MEEESACGGSPDIVSVLKPPRPRIPLKDIMSATNDDDITATRKRRVSFANVNKIKEFSAVAESMVVCQTPAYEEPFSMSSDSSYPSGIDGSTPAKGNPDVSVIPPPSMQMCCPDDKEQYPPTDHHQYQRVSMSKSGMYGNNTEYFAASRYSMGGMEMTECIENQMETMSSIRHSVGMDLTNMQGGIRNSTRYSMGMDLTNAAQSTRYSVGMDLTSVIDRNTRISVSNDAMDFTRAAMSQQQIGDLTTCSDVDLNDSSALELTEAIKEPQFASLYTVNNGENTRYSVNNMDMTKAAMSQNSTRRKSTRYSLVNMDLTEAVNDGDFSGLDFTDVVDDPRIEAMATRYSVNNMDMTEIVSRKSCNQFSTTSSTNNEMSNLEYSADAETSMNLTKVQENDQTLQDRTVDPELKPFEYHCKQSYNFSAEMSLQDSFNNKSDMSMTKAVCFDQEIDKNVSNNMIVSDTPVKTNIKDLDEPAMQSVTCSIIENAHHLNKSKLDATNELFLEKTNMDVSLDSSIRISNSNKAEQESAEMSQAHITHINTTSNNKEQNFVHVEKINNNSNVDISSHCQNALPANTVSSRVSISPLRSAVIDNDLESIDHSSSKLVGEILHNNESRAFENITHEVINSETLSLSRVQNKEKSYSSKGRKSMMPANLESLVLEFKESDSVMELSTMASANDQQMYEENSPAIVKAINLDGSNSAKQTDDQMQSAECGMDISLRATEDLVDETKQSISSPHKRNSNETTTISSHPNLNDSKQLEENVPDTSLLDNSKYQDETINNASLSDLSLQSCTVSVSENIDPDVSNRRITLTRGSASKYSTVFPLSPQVITLTPTATSVGTSPSTTTQCLHKALSPTDKLSTSCSPVAESRKGKRSFEVSLEEENDTEESPLKQICLSREDLINNVTAPSFLMETLEFQNDTMKHEDHLTITLNKTNSNSPGKTQVVVEKPSGSVSVTNITVNKFDTSVNNEFGNNFSLRVDLTNDHDHSSLLVNESINVVIDTSVHKSVFNNTSQDGVVSKDEESFKMDISSPAKNQISETLNKPSPLKAGSVNTTPIKKNVFSKESNNTLSTKKNSKPSISELDSLSELSDDEVIELIKTFKRAQVQDHFFNDTSRVKLIRRGEYICNLIPEWVQLCFSVDTRGHIIRSQYKLSCAEGLRAVGEYVLQELSHSMLLAQTTEQVKVQLTHPTVKQLTRFAHQLSLICRYHNAKLSGNVLKIQVFNVRKHFWAVIDVNIKHHNLQSSDVTISKQKIGEMKLSYVREIFDSTAEGPDRLFYFVQQLSKLRFSS